MEPGLSLDQVKQKQKEFGKNLIQTKQSTSALKLFLSQFLSVINGILVIAAVLSFFIGESLDSIFIFSIIFLDSIFGFIQEYKAEKSLEKLKSYTTSQARVMRDGKEELVSSEDLVPGDIVFLTEGDRIPADGILLKEHHLETDESLLTGESLPVIKEGGDEIYLGMLITKGKGYMKIQNIGMETKFGQIAQTLSTIESEKTPLQIQLARLGRTLSVVAVAVAFLIIPVGIIQGREFTPLLLLAVSIAIAAVPVSLPAVITIALAIGTSRMAKRHAIVRKMPSVETLGAVQYILTDKTGTLTQNRMKVKEVWTDSPKNLSHMFFASVLGNTASLIHKGGKGYEIAGDKTDGALLEWSVKEQQSIHDEISQGTIIDEFVFDSKTKTITTVWKEQKNTHVFVRGAPEAVLERSKVSGEKRKKIEEQYNSFAKKGLRVIAFASKTGSFSKASREQHEKDLTFLGFVGIYDPPREEVKNAIESARKAGIQTIMVTGDNELTAMAIGKEIGLLGENEDVLTGDDLEKFNDAELKKIILKTRIFARTKPQDKMRLTRLLQEQGFVVGVTGDGVNDALALKKADVGVAMGESGTDVAKEASDIVIVDDNFATIVKAIEEGRRIYHNIVKAITYLIAGNISELSLVFFATLLGMPAPLLPTQILWINLVTDGLPALALASDNKDPYALKQPPRDPKIPILNRSRLLLTGSIGLTLSFFLIVLFAILYQFTSETTARTIVFTTLVVSHMGLAFLVRGRNIFRPNKFLIITVIITLLLQSMIIFTPFFYPIFEIGFEL